MANVMYNKFFYGFAQGDINCTGDQIKCALMSTAYTPNADSTIWSDISGNEVSSTVSTDYSAGGSVITSPALTKDDANDLAWFDSADPSWDIFTGTAAYAVLHSTGSGGDTEDKLIGCWDFSGGQAASAGTFTVQVSTDGWFKIEQGTT